MPTQCNHRQGPAPAHPIGRTERLVLDGFRGIDNKAPGHDTPIVTQALNDFAYALELCAKCPLHMGETGARQPSRDEALVLALLSAIQHGDDHVAELCLRELTCANRCAPLAMAASTLAMALKCTGGTLLPVSAVAVTAIVDAPHADTHRVNVN